MTLSKFRKQSTSPIFRLFLLRKLPLAFLAGVKVLSFDDVHCKTSLRFSWINQNPFKSMYFAAMQMAGELSTGLLLYQYIASGLNFSMLLVSIKATYSKKAVGTIQFTCNSGHELDDFIEKINNTEAGASKTFHVIASNEDGEEVAKFEVEWSCKKK